MSFAADIVVTEPDSSQILLIVEAKTNGYLSESEAALKRYMWQMSCPTGLIVSPRSIVIYRNRFTAYSDSSIEKLGEFSAPLSWTAFEGKRSATEFETVVQSWLEALGNDTPEADMPQETKAAFAEHVIPSLMSGEIRAARPRIAK